MKRHFLTTLQDALLVWIALGLGTIITAILYAALNAAQIPRNTSLLIAFLVLVGLIILSLLPIKSTPVVEHLRMIILVKTNRKRRETVNNHASDYYALLGVPIYVSSDEIKSTYRKLVKRYHPDVYRFDNLATQKKAELLMRQINEAYSVLGDSNKRQSYDEKYIELYSGSQRASLETDTQTEDFPLTTIPPAIEPITSRSDSPTSAASIDTETNF